MPDKKLSSACYKPEHRLVKFLLLHASNEGAIRMTQQEIGSHLGATREVVARLLRKLVKEGYAITKRHQVLITHHSRLVDLVSTSRK